MAKKPGNAAVATSEIGEKRKILSQTDVPSMSLEHALRVPRAIVENYADGPVTPLQLASALSMTPSSGPFKMLCGAAIAYELTEGGYNAKEIKLTPLSTRIMKPLTEGDDLAAKREALLRPRVVGEFLNKYNGSPIPREDIALNVLESMKVPKPRAKGAFAMIVEGAKAVGLLREIKDKQYVDLDGVALTIPKNVDERAEPLLNSGHATAEIIPINRSAPPVPTSAPQTTSSNRKVFITHGKDTAFIEPIKKLLGFGEMVPVVSVETQSVSKPVPEKVMDDMRSCGAAIIHVADEMNVIDKDANEHAIINANVLIEIGAAMALYGRRFILLVKEGVKLPSNLQGLYEVRYKGGALDGDATIKLLEAMKDIKNYPLPENK